MTRTARTGRFRRRHDHPLRTAPQSARLSLPSRAVGLFPARTGAAGPQPHGLHASGQCLGLPPGLAGSAQRRRDAGPAHGRHRPPAFASRICPGPGGGPALAGAGLGRRPGRGRRRPGRRQRHGGAGPVRPLFPERPHGFVCRDAGCHGSCRAGLSLLLYPQGTAPAGRGAPCG